MWIFAAQVWSAGVQGLVQRFTSAFEDTKRELEVLTSDLDASFTLQLAAKLNSEELPQKLQDASLVSRATMQAHVKQVRPTTTLPPHARALLAASRKAQLPLSLLALHHATSHGCTGGSLACPQDSNAARCTLVSKFDASCPTGPACCFCICIHNADQICAMFSIRMLIVITCHSHALTIC